MKISRLYLNNIRCFDELEIKFEKPGSSILVIGENGDGKSTVLRSLAMGLCDQSSASALFRELPGEYVRHGAEEEGGRIEVDLNAGSYNYQIVNFGNAKDKKETRLGCDSRRKLFAESSNRNMDHWLHTLPVRY